MVFVFLILTMPLSAQKPSPHWEEAIPLEELPQDLDWLSRWRRLTYDYDGVMMKGTLTLKASFQNGVVTLSHRLGGICSGREGVLEMRSKVTTDLDFIELTYLVERELEENETEWCDSRPGLYRAEAFGDSYVLTGADGGIRSYPLPGSLQTLDLVRRRFMGMPCDEGSETLVRFFTLLGGKGVYRLSCTRIARTGKSYWSRFLLREADSDRLHPREFIVDDLGRLVEFTTSGRRKALLLEAIPR